MNKNWSYTTALAAANAQTAALIEGGFRLCAYGVLAYVDGVFWAEKKVPAATIREQFFGICDAAAYSKSSKYEYAKAAMRLAQDMVKRFGRPDAAKERNAAWDMLAAAADVNEACDMIVAMIKTDYGVTTMRDLFAALSKEKPAKPAKTLAELVVAATQKKVDAGEASSADIAATVMALIDGFLGPDQIAEMLPLLTAKVTTAATKKAA